MKKNRPLIETLMKTLTPEDQSEEDESEGDDTEIVSREED